MDFICALALVVVTDAGYTPSKDDVAMAIEAAQGCRLMFPASPCLGEFRIGKDKNYKVICSAPKERKA